MRDEQVGVGNSHAEMRVFGTVVILRELLHTFHTVWMSRHSQGDHVVDELCMYVQGTYARQLLDVFLLDSAIFPNFLSQNRTLRFLCESISKTSMPVDCLTRKLRQLFHHVTIPGLGVTGLLLFSLLVKLMFSLNATYSESAYPNTAPISVLCNPLILAISAAE